MLHEATRRKNRLLRGTFIAGMSNMFHGLRSSEWQLWHMHLPGRYIPKCWARNQFVHLFSQRLSAQEERPIRIVTDSLMYDSALRVLSQTWLISASSPTAFGIKLSSQMTMFEKRI